MLRCVRAIVTFFACFLLPGMAYGGDDFRLLHIDGHPVKWGKSHMGTGAVVTYAIAQDGFSPNGTVNCRQTTPVSGLLEHSKVTPAEFNGALEAAFALWQQAADIRFLPAKNAATADLVITAERDGDGYAYTDVTPRLNGRAEIAPLVRGIVCLNPNLHWIASESTTSQATQRPKGFRLRYVLAHEIGHALGLDHPSPRGELMSFEYEPDIDQLQRGDLAGIVALYGASRGTSHIAANTPMRAAAP